MFYFLFISLVSSSIYVLYFKSLNQYNKPSLFGLNEFNWLPAFSMFQSFLSLFKFYAYWSCKKRIRVFDFNFSTLFKIAFLNLLSTVLVFIKFGVLCKVIILENTLFFCVLHSWILLNFLDYFPFLLFFTITSTIKIMFCFI